jgi:hypothetical protein
MKKFILIIREDTTKERSMDELYEIIDLHKKWAMDLSRRGFFIDGYGIDEEGVMLSRENGTIMVDEILHPEVAFGGFYIIQAENLEHAMELARECPTFDLGDKIEVRPVL